MGYYSHVRGEVAVSPPLLQLLGERDSEGYLDRAWELRLSNDGATIYPYDDTFKAYDLEDHLGALVRDFPDHSFTGTLRVEGEEAGDIWELVFDGHAVDRVDYEMVPGRRKRVA